MPSLETIGTILGFIIAGVLIGLFRYYQTTGNIPILTKRNTASEAHEQIPEVKDTLNRVEEKVDCVDDKITSVDSKVEFTHETIAYLHSHELEEDGLLRDRLDVDRDDDILND